MEKISLTVNGIQHELEVEANETLSRTLREQLRLTGTKIGCESGACGACSVLVDGRLRNSCLVLTALISGSQVLTIEGLKSGEKLHPVQQAFVEEGAIQCGYCTPGMVLAAVYLLEQNQAPTENEIREAISGNICRCTGYTKIFKAIEKAASTLQAR